MIKYNFNPIKATQIAALLLRLNHDHLSYMKLIKLLYIIDRKSLESWGEPVTTDTYYSLKYGPIVSQIYDYISEPADPDNPDYWNKHIKNQKIHSYSVRLTTDPGDNELSERELNLAQIVDKEFKDYDQWELRDYCHDNFVEWKDPGNSRFPIKVEDILRAIGKKNDEIKAIANENAFYNKLVQETRAST